MGRSLSVAFILMRLLRPDKLPGLAMTYNCHVSRSKSRVPQGIPTGVESLNTLSILDSYLFFNDRRKINDIFSGR